MRVEGLELLVMTRIACLSNIFFRKVVPGKQGAMLSRTYYLTFSCCVILGGSQTFQKLSQALGHPRTLFRPDLAYDAFNMRVLVELDCGLFGMRFG